MYKRMVRTSFVLAAYLGLMGMKAPAQELAHTSAPQKMAVTSQPVLILPSLFPLSTALATQAPSSAAAPAAPVAPETARPPNPPVDSPNLSEEGVTTPPPASPFDWSKFRLGGQYRVEGDASNFGFHSPVITNDQKDQYFVNQRFRLWLTYNPTEHVEGYIQMQVGGINWGTNYDFNKNFPGDFTSLPDDRVGIELRRAWLAVKDEQWGKVRAGILDWHDYFNDTLASSDYDFNTGGIEWTNMLQQCNDFKIRAAILLLNDQAFVTNANAGLSPGSHSAYLYAVDVDQPLAEKTSVGASVYYLNDRGGYSYPTNLPYSSSWDMWAGVRGKTVVNCVPMDGFFLVNTGERSDFGPTGLNHTGWAGQFEVGPVEFGPGKFSSQVVASSGSSTPGMGDSSEFRTVAQSARDNFGSQGYWSYLHVTTPNGPDDVNDLGVSLQNRGLGLLTLQAKYDIPLSAKLLSTTAFGWLRSMNANPASGSSNMGTEVDEQFTYNFGGGLELALGAGVLFTGDFYRAGPAGPSPDNVYEVFARFQLEF